MTKYVCGFCFDEYFKEIALIVKNKPKWQEGKLNGIGGKIEPGELPVGAMRREFREEAGIHVHDWKPLIILSGEDWVVHFFYGSSKEFQYITTQEDEVVLLLKVDKVFPHYEYIDNLEWLIPLAIYKNNNPDISYPTEQEYLDYLTQQNKRNEYK